MAVSASPMAADDGGGLLGALHRVGLGVIAERPVAAAERHRSHHRRRRPFRRCRPRRDDALMSAISSPSAIARILQHHREQRQIVIGQHQRRQVVGKGDEARRLSARLPAAPARPAPGRSAHPGAAAAADRRPPACRSAIACASIGPRIGCWSSGAARRSAIVSALRGSTSISTSIGWSSARVSSG